jgi:5-methylcytosine-specific restriction enzyme A
MDMIGPAKFGRSWGESAPFSTEDGVAYLEAHHIQQLSDGGLDSPTHIAALCPNCHREVHYSVDRDEMKDRLGKAIEEKEGNYVA